MDEHQDVAGRASMCSDFFESQPKIESASQLLFMAEQHIPGSHDSKNLPRRMGTFHLAGYFGLPTIIRTLVSEGGSKGRDNYGRTALTWASGEEHEEVARLLLEGLGTLSIGLDPDTRDRWGRTSISLAAERCHAAVIEIVLRHGANSHITDFWRAAPLLYAARGGYTAIAELLIHQDADVNASGTLRDADHTPLTLAATHGYGDIARLLLAQEGIQLWANPGHWQNERETPLWLAVQEGHSDVVEMLLSHQGVDQGIESWGNTLLYVAAEYGHKDIVQLLLNISFDVNSQGQYGRTPLLLAAHKRQEGVVAVLLSQAGVMVNLADESGLTPVLDAVCTRQAWTLRLF